MDAPIRPTAGLSRVICWLFGASIVLTLIGRITNWLLLDFLVRGGAGGEVGAREEQKVVASEALVVYATSVLFIATAVVFLLWFWRAHANLRDRGWPLRYSPGWAVAWWFIPIANLIEPYRVTADLWRATDPEATKDDWRSVFVPTLIIRWWTLMILAQVVDTIASPVIRSKIEEGDFDGIDTAYAFETVGELAWALAAFLALLMVRRLQPRLEAKLNRLSQADSAEQPGTVPPN